MTGWVNPRSPIKPRAQSFQDFATTRRFCRRFFVFAGAPYIERLRHNQCNASFRARRAVASMDNSGFSVRAAVIVPIWQIDVSRLAYLFYLSPRFIFFKIDVLRLSASSAADCAVNKILLLE